MMKLRQKFIFLTLLFILSVAFLNGQNSKSDLSLSEIDRLIRRTEYDEALNLLNIYIAENPQKFDSAQFRIKKIMNIRQQYAALADRLIQLIKTEPENNKAIYEITAQLEKFERHPSDANLQFIADVKKSAQFNYFRHLFNQIQIESAGLCAEGEYVAALNKLKEGFWLYKDDFYDRWEDYPAFTKTSDRILEDLEKNIAVFENKDNYQKANDLAAKFIQSVNADDLKNANLIFNEVQKSFTNYYALRDRINADSADFKALREETKKAGDDDSTDASFLPFMTRFIDGVDSLEHSGILGVFDSYAQALCERMNETVFKKLCEHYENYVSDDSSETSQKIIQFARLEGKIISLYRTEKENPFDEYRILCTYIINLTNEIEYFKGIQEHVAESFAEQENNIEKLKDPLSEKKIVLSAIFALMQDVKKITGLQTEHNLISNIWAQNYNELSSEQWKELSDHYNNLVSGIFAEVQKIDAVSWTWITRFYNQESSALVTKARNKNTAAETCLNGLSETIPKEEIAVFKKNPEKIVKYIVQEDAEEAVPADDVEILYCYPNFAKAVSLANLKEIDESITEITKNAEMLNQFFYENPVWQEDEEISLIFSDSQKYLSVNNGILLELRKYCDELLSASDAKILLAKVSENEGDIRFAEAESALKNKDYQNARKKLQDSLTKYQQSLSNQEDEDLRNRCDKKLFALAQKITSAENEYVVVEVRRLKNLAKDAYFNGRFEDSEKYLIQAKNRWQDTNAEEDPEITNLMTFVNTAVSMQTGREISPSSPQYPEMSQLLDIAYKYYDSGSKKYTSGDKKEGEEELQKSLDSIQKLQYVYPLNQEASILTLRINRLKNPQKFQEEFSQKIEAAQFMCKSQNTRREGYANLLDYYALAPDYPGLKDIVYQTEIEIGVRQKPVDNSTQIKAQNLYAEARKLYNSSGSDKTGLEHALKIINQSLSLNSNNKDAEKLKDAITTKIGGTSSTVLSTEDERLYQLAIQRLQSNNISGANAIVARLLQKPQNLNSQKIKDLKVKIDARS